MPKYYFVILQNIVAQKHNFKKKQGKMAEKISQKNRCILHKIAVRPCNGQRFFPFCMPKYYLANVLIFFKIYTRPRTSMAFSIRDSAKIKADWRSVRRSQVVLCSSRE